MMMGFKDVPFDQGVRGHRNYYTNGNNESINSGTFLSLGGYATKIYDTGTSNDANVFSDNYQCPEWRFSDSGNKIIFSFRSKLSYKGTSTGIAVLGQMDLSTSWDLSSLNRSSLEIVELPDTANPNAVGNFDMSSSGVTYYRPYHKIRFGDSGQKMYLMECSGQARGQGSTTSDTRIFQYTLASA
jgi:hypothetical protein